MTVYEYGIALRSKPFEAHRWDMTETEAQTWLRGWVEDFDPDLDLGSRDILIRRPKGQWEAVDG